MTISCTASMNDQQPPLSEPYDREHSSFLCHAVILLALVSACHMRRGRLSCSHPCTAARYWSAFYLKDDTDQLTAGRASRPNTQQVPDKAPEELHLRTPSNIMSTFGKGAAASRPSLLDILSPRGSDLPYSESSEDASLSAAEGEVSDQEEQVRGTWQKSRPLKFANCT